MNKIYQVVVSNIGQVYIGGKTAAHAAFRDYRERSKDGYGRVSGEEVTVFCGDEIVKEYLPTIKLPPVGELTRLIKFLKREIGDEYRASDDDTTPSMLVTIGANKQGEWSYQTGDNSCTGGAYSFPHWAVVAIHRRSNSHNVAIDIREQLGEAMS